MINRRTALGLIGAAVGVVATGGTARANKRGFPAPDLTDKKQLALAYRKLAYSLDDSVTFWWMRGTRYGVIDSVATPFWDMHIGLWFQTRDLDADSYEVTLASANFYTPVNTAELLEVFHNPYTGADVPVKYATPKPWRIVIGREGHSAFGGAAPGMTVTRSEDPGPGWIEGQDVVIRGDSVMNAVPTDPSSGKKGRSVNDWSTYVASLDDIANPKVKNAPGVQYFNDILTYPAWLQMGDHAGSYVSRCFGRKVFSYAQMPALWRRLYEKALPESAKDAAGVLKTIAPST